MYLSDIRPDMAFAFVFEWFGGWVRATSLILFCLVRFKCRNFNAAHNTFPIRRLLFRSRSRSFPFTLKTYAQYFYVKSPNVSELKGNT